MSLPLVHVALASNLKGSEGLAVTVFSLLQHTARDVKVWVIEDGLGADIKDHLIHVWQRAKTRVSAEFIPFSSLPIPFPSWWANSRWPLLACGRFQLAEVLPADVTRCIYLDIDMLVGADIGELFDVDLRGLPLGMVQNDNMSDTDCAYLRSIGLDPERYANSGLLLIDVDAWRRESAAVKLVERGRSMPANLWFFDQDMLNAHFKNRYLLLDKRWNFRDAAAAPDDKIIHFAGGLKPWAVGAETDQSAGFAAWRLTRATSAFVTPQLRLSNRLWVATRSKWAGLQRRIRRTFV